MSLEIKQEDGSSPSANVMHVRHNSNNRSANLDLYERNGRVKDPNIARIRLLTLRIDTGCHMNNLLILATVSLSAPEFGQKVTVRTFAPQNEKRATLSHFMLYDFVTIVHFLTTILCSHICEQPEKNGHCRFDIIHPH